MVQLIWMSLNYFSEETEVKVESIPMKPSQFLLLLFMLCIRIVCVCVNCIDRDRHTIGTPFLLLLLSWSSVQLTL